jgi:hypothetical protein
MSDLPTPPTRPPFGPDAAAMLAAGIGCWTLGLLVALSQLSQTFADALVLMPRVGPLSGQAICASVVFFASWRGLALLWKRKDPPERTIYWATAVLVVIGLLLTFPPVFQAI